MSSITTGVYHRSYRADLALRHTLTEYVRLALVLAAVVAAPFVASPYWVHVLDDIGIAVIGAIGLNILVGYTGLVSFGHGAWFGLAAYAAALIQRNLMSDSFFGPMVGPKNESCIQLRWISAAA